MINKIILTHLAFLLIFLVTLNFAFAQTYSQQQNYCPDLKYFQQLGSRDRNNNGETSKLQNFLKQNLNLTNQQFLVTGYFGRITKEFVEQFQENNNLVISGQVGRITRAKILNTCNSILNPVCMALPNCANPPTGCRYENTSGSDCTCGKLVCNTPVCSYQPDVNSCQAGFHIESIQNPGGASCSNISVCKINTSGGNTNYCSFNNQTILHGNSTTTYSQNWASETSTCSQLSQIRTCNNGNLSGTYTYPTCTQYGGQQITYSWSSGNWSTCNNNQQTRTVSCLSSTGQTVSDSFCTQTKPANTQSCNSQPVVTSTQSVLLSGLNNGATTSVPTGWTPDFYSAEPVKWNNKIRIYFGGWYESNPTDFFDDIYVADCEYKGGPCNNVRKVIDSFATFGGALNDPSIVLIQPTNGSRAYYIMYMTCVRHNATEYNTCYSTSWADDGINWGNPRNFTFKCCPSFGNN